MTRTSASLLNVKFVRVLSAVTVITPNQYSAESWQRGTFYLTLPPSLRLADDDGNYPTSRRGEKTRSVTGSSTEFSEGGERGESGDRKPPGNRE